MLLWRESRFPCRHRSPLRMEKQGGEIPIVLVIEFEISRTRTKIFSRTLDFGLWAWDFNLRAVSKMLKASGAMAAATLFSRVLGLVREQAYMFFLGTTWVNDAFQYAFTIPNLFRRLLGEGALTAAFIPIFKEKEKAHGEIEMWRAANAVISGLIVSASVIVAIVMIGISIALAFGSPHQSAQ